VSPRRGFFWGAARRGSGSAAPHREPSGTSLRTAATLNQRLATGAAANCLRSSGALPVFTASGAVPSEAPRSLSGSIRTMGDVTVVVVIWAWRCGSGARYSAHAPADRRTDAGTTPAARDRADYSPSAGANQTAAHRPIGGIVRVREGCGRQHQSSADHAGYGRLLRHSLSAEKLRSGAGLLISLRSRSGSTRHTARQTNGTGSQFQSLAARAFAPPAAALGLTYDQLHHHLQETRAQRTALTMLLREVEVGQRRSQIEARGAMDQVSTIPHAI